LQKSQNAKKEIIMAVKKEDIATVGSTALGAPIDFSADAGMGMEGTDRASFAIPFLTILQGLSPQIETVEGAKPGLYINTITTELYREALVIPCAYQRRFNRWAPREQGGGYRGEYSPVDVELGKLAGLDTNEKGQTTIEGDLLKDTRNHFVLVQSESGAWQPAIISLSSTQIKKSKRWMSLIQGIEMRAPGSAKSFNPPSFSHVYKMTAKKEENSQGSWWGVDIAVVGPVQDHETYAKAKAFHASVASGDIEVAQPQDDVRHDDSAF